MGDFAKMRASISITFTPATYDSAYPLPYSASGAVDVTPDTAMTIAAVYACVRAISEDIASVPLQIFQRSGESRKLADNHPLYDLLHDQPNDIQTAMEFREMMTAFAMLRRRAVAELITGPRGFVDQIRPLHPDLVRPELDVDGNLRYVYEDPIKHRPRILLPDEVMVLRGPFGRSITDFARETFALAMTMRGAANRAYDRGVRSQGAVTHPKTLSEPARTALRSALDKYSSGGEHEGRPLLLEEGMSWTSIQMSLKDAEIVAMSGATAEDCVRFFRVPQHKVGYLEHATFSNIEQQSIEYVTDTIRPWAERWEGVIRRDLILAPHIFFAEHNLEGLLRGDISTRYAAYAIGRQWGWLATNDIRRKENLNPIDAGDDDFLVPMNMQTHDGLLQFAPPARQAALAAQLRVMVRDAAGRAIRKEQAALAKLNDKTGGKGPEWEAGVRAFYDEHARFLASLHLVPAERSDAYCARRLAAALAGESADETEDIGELTTLALDSGLVPVSESTAHPARSSNGEQPNVYLTLHQAPVSVTTPPMPEGLVKVDVHTPPVQVAPPAVSVSVLPRPPMRKVVEHDGRGKAIAITEEPA